MNDKTTDSAQVLQGIIVHISNLLIEKITKHVDEEDISIEKLLFFVISFVSRIYMISTKRPDWNYILHSVIHDMMKFIDEEFFDEPRYQYLVDSYEAHRKIYWDNAIKVLIDEEGASSEAVNTMLQDLWMSSIKREGMAPPAQYFSDCGQILRTYGPLTRVGVMRNGN